MAALYESPSKQLEDKLKKYKKAMEKIYVSKPIELYNKLYREVIFEKGGLNVFSTSPQNYMYVDENDDIIEDKIFCERLARIFYYMDIYLNEEKGSVLAALQDEDDTNRDKHDYKSVLEGLELLKNKNKEDVEKVRYVIERLPKLREKTNEKLKILKEQIEIEKEKNKYFNEKMIEVLYPYYRNVMEINYEKILLIGKAKDNYVELKKNADKKRRTNNLLFNTRHTEKLMRTHYVLGYYSNLLRSYGNVIDMNYNQYIRTLDNAGFRMAKNKMASLRNA
ncbi:hypothetical protein [Clostridium ihumii]|uniref:hypothetical protein n=1 Tax=Clostridium ihumii TaxID=1470356 RepID=UPI003D3362C4